MKRVTATVSVALFTVVLWASQALAQYPPNKTTAPPGTAGGPGGPAADTPGVAFTGANITVGLVILIGLIVLGVALYVLSRRRRAA